MTLKISRLILCLAASDVRRYAMRVMGSNHEADQAPSGPELTIPVTPELIVAEYNAARADCLQGLVGQQSILTWSIAAIGVLFAAGLSISTNVHGAEIVRPWIFLIGIPLLTLGASIAWFGEIFRMERDAHYMRLLEQSTWPSDLIEKYENNKCMVTDDMVKYQRLMLNMWVARADPLSRNRVVGYAGGIIIYWGATAGALAVGATLLHEYRTTAFVSGVAWLAIYIVITIIQLARIVDYSELGLDEAVIDLASPRVPKRRSKQNTLTSDAADTTGGPNE